MTTRILLTALRSGFLFCLLFSQVVKADALGLFFGVSGWTADMSGDVQSGPSPVDVEDDLGFDTETLTQAYLAFEHFVPLIPNIRLQYTDLDFEGNAVLNKRFDGIDFSGDVSTEFNMSQTDLIAYWRLLDNVVNLDIGLQVSLVEGDFSIQQADQSANDSSTSADEYIPMGYLSAGIDLPLTGLSVNAGFSGGGNFDSHRYTDIRASLIYELDFIGAEIGWRKLDLDLDDVSDVDADLSVSGPYIGVSLQFGVL